MNVGVNEERERKKKKNEEFEYLNIPNNAVDNTYHIILNTHAIVIYACVIYYLYRA